MLAFLTANRDEAGWGRLNRMNPRSLFEGAPQDGRAIEETLDDLPVNLVVRSCELWCNLDVGGGGTGIQVQGSHLRKNRKKKRRAISRFLVLLAKEDVAFSYDTTNTRDSHLIITNRYITHVRVWGKLIAGIFEILSDDPIALLITESRQRKRAPTRQAQHRHLMTKPDHVFSFPISVSAPCPGGKEPAEFFRLTANPYINNNKEERERS